MKKLLENRTTVIKVMLIVLAIVNNALALFEKSPLPFSDQEAEQFLSSCFTGIALVAAWFHNNFPQEKTKEES